MLVTRPLSKCEYQLGEANLERAGRGEKTYSSVSLAAPQSSNANRPVRFFCLTQLCVLRRGTRRDSSIDVQTFSSVMANDGDSSSGGGCGGDGASSRVFLKSDCFRSKEDVKRNSCERLKEEESDQDRDGTFYTFPHMQVRPSVAL